MLSVIVTAHNEAPRIVSRIVNILEQQYPPDRFEVIVASDGSDDGTDDLAAQVTDRRVQIIRSARQVGKSLMQNRAVEQASGDIVVFTDAGTMFAPDFLTEIAAAFSDKEIGAADGRLVFQETQGNMLSVTHGRYWAYELDLRDLESRLGILAVASGACVAVRRSLFRPLDAAYGEDCMIPLDTVMAGSKVIHRLSAIAYETPVDNRRKEFRARVRMTQRNIQGTWSRRALLNPLRFPGYAFSLWSHKMLRWFSPFFLLAAAVSSGRLAAQGDTLFRVITGAEGLALMVGVLGPYLRSLGLRIPFFEACSAFILANVGFALGIWRALRGDRITAYR
jgi:cellulose synthase/poly-beta-1,6-N-acetylglucosamine synthase-like glycosyltransferase